MTAFHAMTVPIYRLCCLFSLIMCVIQTPALAQVTTTITPDGSLGTTVNLHGSVHVVDGGTIRGPNQFHSFDRFDVGAGKTANFTGPASVENILSRVTGGQQSMIDGVLQSNIPGANLYLLNPAGILFGPNASLDVGGSFHMSTANMIELKGGGAFHTDPSKPERLSVAPPSAFGFLEPTSPITVQGSTLRVSEGKSISMVGGDIRIMGGSLLAPSGRVNLVSTASSGEVHLDVEALDGALELCDFDALELCDFDALGDIVFDVIPQTFTNARIDISRRQSGAGSTGRIELHANNLRLDNATDVAAFNDSEGPGPLINIELLGQLDILEGSTIDTSNSFRAGDITVSAKHIELGDFSAIRSEARGDHKGGDLQVVAQTLEIHGGLISTQGGGRAPSGSIDIAVDTLSITHFGRISSRAFSSGNGGSITITAREAIALQDRGTEITSASESGPVDEVSFGDAGAIMISTQRLSITDQAVIRSSTDGAGNGGMIHIQAETIRLQNTTDSPPLSSTGIFAETGPDTSDDFFGQGGNIHIDTTDLEIDPGTQISASSLGRGAGGKIEIFAETMILDGSGSPTNVFTGITAQTDVPTRFFLSAQGGDGGDISIGSKLCPVGQLNVVGGARISAATNATGTGGTITVFADMVRLDGHAAPDGPVSGIIVNTSGSGRGGDITVNAGQVELAEGAHLAAQSSDLGNAGDIAISAMTLFLRDGSEVSTSTLLSDGGDIHVIINSMQLRDGRMTTSVGDGKGSGGNIIVDTNLGLLERSEIRADAFGGPGGNITIRADGFITDVDSVISASSQQSVDGTVSIQGLVDLSGSLAPLDPSFAAAAALQSDPCIGRLRGEGISRFTRAGRDRLPTEPGGLLPSPSDMAAAMAPPARRAARLSQGQPHPASALTAWHRDCVR